MKLFSFLSVVALIFFSVNCGSAFVNSNKEYTGTIEAAGITSYQYGTHKLISGDNFYALKSDKINLSEFEGKEITLTASLIEGYPVDAGPEFLLVTSVLE